MLGLRRRKNIEGWAAEVSNADGEMERQGILQRIGDNNKAWVICFIGVVILTVFFVKFSKRTYGGHVADPVPNRAPDYFRERPRYTQFEADFRTDKRFVESVVDARFLSPGQFQVVVASGTSADDIDYLARMAAERVLYVFHHRTVVQVYKRSFGGDSKLLIATAQWKGKKRGYGVRFQSDTRRAN